MSEFSAVLDAHALITYLEREEGFLTVLERFTQSLSGGSDTAMTVVNAGEVLYVVRRGYGDEVAEEIEKVIRTLPITLVDVDLELARLAARFKAEGGISYADCFAAALAVKEGVPVVTGDPEFRAVEGQVDVEWLR